MGRPRQHDEQTAAQLLEAAERIVDQDGIAALSVRRLATAVGTTTRAVYSLFGSKEGLVVALGARAFELLEAGIEALPETADPQTDLVEAGVKVFRRFAVDHPSLFELAVQRSSAPPELAAAVKPSAAHALDRLRSRVARVDAAGLLGGRRIEIATLEFHALCEGLAALELRGALGRRRAVKIWRDALGALVTGFAHAPAP